jgi:hypothetical protein
MSNHHFFFTSIGAGEQLPPTVFDVGAPTTYSGASTSSQAVCVIYEPVAKKTVYFFKKSSDNSVHGAVLDINDEGDITAISSTTLVASLNPARIEACFDSVNNKIVLAIEISGAVYSVVVTVTGSSMSAGSSALVLSGTSSGGYTDICFDEISSKVLVCFRSNGTSDGVYAKVGTVSGTSISFGSTQNIRTGINPSFSNVHYDSGSQKIIAMYGDANNKWARTATISGTTLTVGTEYATNPQSGGAAGWDKSCIAPNKIIYMHRDNTFGDGWNGYARVGVISGTTITWGSWYLFEGGNAESMHAVWDNVTERLAITYNEAVSGNHQRIVIGSIDGSVITFRSPVQIYASSDAWYGGITYDENIDRVVTVFHQRVSPWPERLMAIRTGDTE